MTAPDLTAARLTRAGAALLKATDAGNRRKARQWRRRFNAVLRTGTLAGYLAWLNRDADGMALTDDLDHWALIGVRTAPELARYLDACVERERQKDDRWSGHDDEGDDEPEHDGQPDEAQEWHDFDPDC